MSKYNFFNCHNHTDYSNIALIDSINSVEKLIDSAYEKGLKGIAITDHECLSSHFRALKHYNKKYKDKEFTLALGNEIYLTREGLTSSTHKTGERFYHCILIAKDKVGHAQLREISSRAWDRGYFRALMRRPTYISDLMEIVGNDKGHLLCTTACLGGYAGASFQNGDFDAVDGYIQTMYEIFGNDFYVELQPNTGKEQIDYNNFMIERYWDILPFTVATDSHYLDKEEFSLFKEYLNSKEDKGNREVEYFYSSAYLMNGEEVMEYMESEIGSNKVEQLFATSMDMLNKVEDYTLDYGQIVPVIEYEWDNRQDVYRENFIKLVEPYDVPNLKRYLRADGADKYLTHLIAEGAIDLLGDDLFNNTQEYAERLDEELYHIHAISENIGQPLSNYLITMGKIIELVWTQGDSLVGPGRGSGCGSLINYLCGITQLNPLRQELVMPFWRFLHESRPELPDIDFDTESSKRQRIFNAVLAYFRNIGGDVINVATFGTLGTKNSLKTAARGLKLDDTIINYIASMVPTERGKDWTLDQCRNGDAEHKAIKQFNEQMEKYPQLWNLAKRIEGLITNLSVHASGVIITNGKIIDHNSVMKTNGGVRVTAWDLHDSEAMGGLKYDFLTVEALDKIRTCMNLLLDDGRMEWQGDLKSTYEKYLLPKNLEYNDPDMWKMAANGEILELFQFDTLVGSRAVRLIQPTKIADLTAGNSIMRLMADGEQPLEVFAKYKNNINLWYKEMARFGLCEEEIQLMEKYVLPVYGVAGSQELAMMLVMDENIAGFTISEANALRKGIAKKVPEVLKKIQNLFFEKGAERGTRRVLLEYVWKVQISRQLG